MRFTIARLTALMLFAAPGLAIDVESATLSTDLTYGYSRELRAGTQGQVALTPSVRLTVDESVSLKVSGRVLLDANNELGPSYTSLDAYAGVSEPFEIGGRGTAEIRDMYLEYNAASGVIRLGKQPIVWGRMDGIKVLDLLNPQNFREFILDDFEDSRISLWSAYLDYSLGEWRAELALIPDGTGHAIAEKGAWFEMTAPRFRFGAAQGGGVLPQRTVRPDHSLDDTALGLRLSRRIGSVDFSAVVYSGIDPEPLGRIVQHEGSPIVQRFHRRRNALGVSLEKSLGSAVVRAEYAYQPNRDFNTRLSDRLGMVGLDQHRAAVGVDIDGPHGVFINLQYLIDSIPNAPAGLIRPDTDRIAMIFLRRTFGYDRVSLEARWYRSLTDGDQLVSAGVDYAFTQSASLGFHVHAFSGKSTGQFGQFADRDGITLSLQHVF